MRLRYCLPALALLTALAACGEGFDPARVAPHAAPSIVGTDDAPEAAPDFTLAGPDGPFALADHRGRVVVVTFWSTENAPSVAGLDTLAVLAADLAGEGLVAVGVAQDERGMVALRAWADAEVSGPRAAVALVADPDHTVSRRYGDVEMLPTTVVVDRRGRLRGRHVGVPSTDELLDLVAPVLIEDEEPMARVRPSARRARPAAIRALEPEAIPNLVATGAALLDVRDAGSVAAEGSIRHAAHRPLASLDVSDLPANVAAPVIFLGATEAEARAAAELAAGWGYGVVYAVGGGAAVWRAAGLPMAPVAVRTAAGGVIG